VVAPHALLLDVQNRLGLKGPNGRHDIQCAGPARCWWTAGGQRLYHHLAREVDGRDVRTVEGLMTANRFILREAFVERGAVQCGFCTSECY
jgi:carbon-monoxide dehydrogenase small subunit